MKLLYAALVTCLVSIIHVESLFSYDGWKVYKVKVTTESDANFLKSLDDLDGFDFWSLARLLGTEATVMVHPEQQESFETSLSERTIQHEILNDDLEKTFASERKAQLIRSHQRSEVLNFDRYYQHDEINRFLDFLDKNSAKSPQVKVKIAGKSYEGREMKTITITNGDGQQKNSIFIDAGIHAREWIAPATALFLITQLVDPQSNYSKLLDEVDFVILPVVNPDGYEYTFKSDRMWRRTRSKNSQRCVGTDANRNFDFHWGEIGASENSCDSDFRGEKAFSEIETQILRDTVMELRGSCKFYLTLHSFGNYMLYPWGWTSDLPDNWKDQDEIGHIGAEAVQEATGSRYTVGSSTNVLYPAAGGSDDYMHAIAGVPVAITMELPGGNYGFDPPASKIKKIVKESAIGIFAMSEAIAKKYKN